MHNLLANKYDILFSTKINDSSLLERDMGITFRYALCLQTRIMKRIMCHNLLKSVNSYYRNLQVSSRLQACIAW